MSRLKGVIPSHEDSQPLTRKRGDRRLSPLKSIETLNGWAGVAFTALGVVVGILTATGRGPTPDIALHFDSGSEYDVRAIPINWFLVGACAVATFSCACASQGGAASGWEFWIYCWNPLVTALLVVDLAGLSRVRDGFLLATLSLLAYQVSIMELTRSHIKTGSFKEGLWLRLVMLAGWALILFVLWYTAAWSERNVGSATPDYVIPVLAVVTCLVGATKLAVLVNRFPSPWWRECILLCSQFAQLAVCAFVPML